MTRPAPAATVSDWRVRGRWGWLFGGIWLIYLGETFAALRSASNGPVRVLGFAALAGFVVAYLSIMGEVRSARFNDVAQSPARRWGQLSGLLLLVGCMVPGAGEHALTALVFVVATAMMSLQLRSAWLLTVAIFVSGQVALAWVPGWQWDPGYGLAVLLAAVAVWGMRMVMERNRQLVAVQHELAHAAVESERSRIATDLHDILGHSLTVITVKAELAGRLLDVDVDAARKEIHELENLSRDALADVRATAMGLRGVSLSGEIVAARSALESAGITAELPAVADEVPSRWRELFAWTLREAVTNLIRHSGAASCSVRLTPRSLEILDDGHGCPVAMAARGRDDDQLPASSVGQGLVGLRQRAEALGAKLEAMDRVDRPGFRVRVEVPA